SRSPSPRAESTDRQERGHGYPEPVPRFTLPDAGAPDPPNRSQTLTRTDQRLHPGHKNRAPHGIRTEQRYGETTMPLHFDNSYARLPERFYARVPPTPVAAPSWLVVNPALGAELGLE